MMENIIRYWVIDDDKNSSGPKLVLENIKPKNNHRLFIRNLNIKSVSNNFDNLKLIIRDKVNLFRGYSRN